MTRSLQKLAPLAVLLLGVGAAGVLWFSKPAPQKTTPVEERPAVRVVQAQASNAKIRIRAQGTVEALREIDLVPQVAGQIIQVAPEFVSGGFFRAGDLLVAIEPRDFEFQVTRAAANVAAAQQRLALEQAEAEQAAKEWADLGQGRPSALVLREPQLAEARANLAASKAELEQAELSLSRTRITAPFDGRIRSRNVDAGQYVTLGQALARIYSTDIAEIRLPLEDSDLRFLDLSLRAQDQSGPLPQVELMAEFAGEMRRWRGQIVRTEGALDARSRMLPVVAQVNDPYGRQLAAGADFIPLSVGMFVEAEIMGREFENVIEIPRIALRGTDQVFVVDGQNRLRERRVEVLRSRSEGVLVTSGLEPGDRVLSTVLDAPVEGMGVQIIQSLDQGPLVQRPSGRDPGGLDSGGRGGQALPGRASGGGGLGAVAP